jgi:hypothetical protein
MTFFVAPASSVPITSDWCRRETTAWKKHFARAGQGPRPTRPRRWRGDIGPVPRRCSGRTARPGSAAPDDVQHIGDDLRRTQQRLVFDSLGDGNDRHARRHVPRQPLPHVPHVLRRHGRENQRAAVETFGIVGGEPQVSRQFHAGQKPLIFAVLEQAVDRFLERPPERHLVSALAEQERTDRRHRAVADDCHALGHGGNLRLPIADCQLAIGHLSAADAVFQSAGAIPLPASSGDVRTMLKFVSPASGFLTARWIQFPSSFRQANRSIAAALSNSEVISSASSRFILRGDKFRIAESIAASAASNPSRVIPSIGSRCVDDGTRMLKRAERLFDLLSGRLVNISQIARGAPMTPARSSNTWASSSRQRQIAVGLQAPAHRRPGGQAGVADGQILQMAVIAPIGVEISDGAVFQAGLGGAR